MTRINSLRPFADSVGCPMKSLDDPAGRAEAHQPPEGDRLRAELALCRAALDAARDCQSAGEVRAAELSRANTALQSACSGLIGEDGLDTFLGQVLVEASAVADSLSATIFVHDPSIDTLTMRAFVHEGRVTDIAFDRRLAFLRDPVVLDATTRPAWDRIRSGVLIEGTLDGEEGESWPFAVEFHRRMGHRSTFSVPLEAGGGPLGFLALHFTNPPQLTAERLGLAQALSQQASLALQLTRLTDAAREASAARERETAAEERAAKLAQVNEALLVRSSMLNVVAEITTLLLTGKDLEAAIPEVLRQAGEAAALSRVKFFIEEERCPGGPIDYRVAYEWCAPGLTLQATLGISVISAEDVIALAPGLSDGHAYWLQIDEVPPPAQQIFRRAGVWSTGCVPVFVDGRFAACLAFDDCVGP